MIFGYSQEAEAVGGTIFDQTSCEAIDGDWRPDTPSVGINTCQLSVGLIIEDGEILRISDIVLRITSSVVGIIINNGGTLTNSGTIDINGGFELRIGTINNNIDGIIVNRGPGGISINFGTFNNDGLILNKDDIITFGTAIIENSGTIENTGGTIFTRDRTTFNNSGEIINNRGIIINIDRSIITNSGTIDNSGTINNFGIFATINNSGDIGNSGTGIISNFGTINNGDPSETRSGRIDNFGTIENSDGTINNFEIFGTINNCGTINGEISGVQPNPICPTCDDDIIDPVIDLGETCDDGNTVPADGCSATCQTEAGFECTGEPSICTTTCGDSIIAGSETCDDGNASNTDDCLNTCQLASCGDGFVHAGVEECDDGNQNNGDVCSNTCLFTTGGQVGFKMNLLSFCGGTAASINPSIVDQDTPPNLELTPRTQVTVTSTGTGAALVTASATDYLNVNGIVRMLANALHFGPSTTDDYSVMTPMSNDPLNPVVFIQQHLPGTDVIRQLLTLVNYNNAVTDPNTGDPVLQPLTMLVDLVFTCPNTCPGPNQIVDNGECVVPFSCRSNADCDDGNLCTDDSCESAICVFTSLGGASCNTGEPGVCAAGTQICQGGTVSCEPNMGPSTEICDGLDNDCDGAADETFDLGNDRLNCGTCGNVCEGVRGQCVGGVCEPLLSSGPAVICSCLGFIDVVLLCVDTCEPFPGGFCRDSGCSVDQSGGQQLFCEPVVECIRVTG